MLEKHKKNNISFFMPVWNCENFIGEALDSIIQTNFKEGDEIVITDDCSTDNTVEVIKKYQDRYNFIKLLHHKENKGCASSRNTAIKQCKNEILFCLDADNILEPNSVQKLKKFMLKNEADSACFGGLNYFKDSKTKKTTHKWRYKKGIHTLADCLSGPISPISSGNYMLTKKSCKKAGGYLKLTRILDTWTFGLKQLATGTKLIAMPNSFYFHRSSHQSNWAHYSKKINVSLLVYSILKPFLNLIDEEDIKYIEDNKDTWFLNIEKHPIKVKNIGYGKNGKVIRRKKPFKFIKDRLRKISFLRKTYKKIKKYYITKNK